MIVENRPCRPWRATVTRDGKYTIYDVPQTHKEGDTVVRDGFIHVVSRGAFDFKKGDQIMIRKIKRAKLECYKGATQYSIYCTVEPIIKDAEAIADSLVDDIPEELL